MTENRQTGKRLVVHGHRRRPLRNWIIPLLIVVAIIILLPRLLELLE